MSNSAQKSVPETEREYSVIKEIIVVLGGLAIIGAFALWVLGEARADGRMEAAKIGTKLDLLADDYAEHKRQENVNVHELQLDVRALYKAQMNGQRQPRLEREPEISIGDKP